MRGTTLNIANRFETRSTESFDDGWSDLERLELPVVETQFFPDHTKSILSKNDSPDIGFTYSLNPYRGCEHGCAYCYARPTHEYLGFNAALDFESKIMVKHDAAELLRKEFDKKSWKPQVVVVSGNTDCYQPAERHYRITRRIMETCLEYRNPVGIITKNALVLRDIDLFKEMATMDLVKINLSITSLDRQLARKLEPRTATPERRLEAIRRLSSVGVMCGVMIGPVIPGLNDDEIPAILTAAREAGAISAGFNMVRLPYAVAPIFAEWVEREVPLKAKRILTRIGMVRDGKMNDPNFGSRMRGEGAYAQYIEQVFSKTLKKLGFDEERRPLRTDLFRRAGAMTLFD